MLSVKEAQSIGINACIDRIGRDFVYANRGRATAACGENEDSVFCFMGVDDERCPVGDGDVLVLDDRSRFPYRASCNVALSNGSTSFVECVAP